MTVPFSVGGGHQPQVRFRHEPRAPRLRDCPDFAQKQDSAARGMLWMVIDSKRRSLSSLRPWRVTAQFVIAINALAVGSACISLRS
jgi:hypothetical protein